MFRRKGYSIPGVMAAACVCVIVVYTTMIAVKEAEAKWRPVMKDWTVTEKRTDGADVIISGVVRKVRPCEYEPPPIAIGQRGENYAVVSTSAAPAVSLPATGVQLQFGPWRIVGGAGRQFTMYQEHRCHPLWIQLTKLGEVQ